MNDRQGLITLLLQRSEDETLDFKATGYGFPRVSLGRTDGGDTRSKTPSLSRDERKRDFAKDLASLANTPRSEDAHLVLGVKKDPDTSTTLWGLRDTDRDVDDADLQSVAQSLLNNCPRFLYETVEYQGVLLGLVTIPPDLRAPCTPKMTIDNGFRENVIYFRRGSQNAEASSVDDQMQIWRFWLGDASQPPADDDNQFASPAPWEQYLMQVGRLESSGVRHILLVDAGFGELAGHLAGLGTGP